MRKKIIVVALVLAGLVGGALPASAHSTANHSCTTHGIQANGPDQSQGAPGHSATCYVHYPGTGWHVTIKHYVRICHGQACSWSYSYTSSQYH